MAAARGKNMARKLVQANTWDAGGRTGGRGEVGGGEGRSPSVWARRPLATRLCGAAGTHRRHEDDADEVGPPGGGLKRLELVDVQGANDDGGTRTGAANTPRAQHRVGCAGRGRVSQSPHVRLDAAPWVASKSGALGAGVGGGAVARIVRPLPGHALEFCTMSLKLGLGVTMHLLGGRRAGEGQQRGGGGHSVLCTQPKLTWWSRSPRAGPPA